MAGRRFPHPATLPFQPPAHAMAQSHAQRNDTSNQRDDGRYSGAISGFSILMGISVDFK